MAKMINRYGRLLEAVFERYYKEGDREVAFDREEFISIADELGIKVPKNLGDVVYSFRYRNRLPESIESRAPEGMEWVIRPKGKGKYAFSLTRMSNITPNALLSETKVPDSTPGIIERYALTDEQALLAKVRYNRLIDIFSGVTCYSLQNHLRTTVPEMGQVEVDEVYVGVDRRGAHYVFPVQAKGGNDKLGIVQIEQDVALCADKFPELVCRPIAAQFMSNNLIALLSFEDGPDGLAIADEKHYRLVPPEQMTDEDLRTYRNRAVTTG